MAERTRRDSRCGGFTLLEVMVALAVLAVGVLGVTAGQIMAMRLSSSSRTHNAAMYLAEQQLEMLQVDPAADVKARTTEVDYPNDPDNPIDAVDGSGAKFNRRAFIEADTPETGIITITVEVDWVNSLGLDQTVRVQSFKADL